MPKFGRTVVIKLTENCTFSTTEYLYYLLVYVMVVGVTFRIGSALFGLFFEKKEPGVFEEKTPGDTESIIKKIRGGEFLKKLSLSDLLRLKKLLICLEKSASAGFVLAILDEKTNRLLLRLMQDLLPKKPSSVGGLVKSGGREVVKFVNLFRNRPEKLIYNIIKITPSLLRRLITIHTTHYSDTTMVAIQYFGLVVFVNWFDVKVVLSRTLVTIMGAFFTGSMLLLAKYGFLSFFTTLGSAVTSIFLGFLLIIHLQTGVPVCFDELLALPALPAVETIKQNVPKEMPKIDVVLPSHWRLGREKNDDQVIVVPDDKQIEIYEDIILGSDNRISMPNGYVKIDNERITELKPEDVDKIVNRLDPEYIRHLKGFEEYVKNSKGLEEYVRNECQKVTKSSSDKPKRSQSSSFAEAAELKPKKRKRKFVSIDERTDTIFTVQKREQEQEKLIQMNQNGNDGTSENGLGLAIRDLLEDHFITISDIDEMIQVKQKN